MKDLYRTRNMRLAFRTVLCGRVKAALITLTGGGSEWQDRDAARRRRGALTDAGGSPGIILMVV